uniref:Uncharacterized protein n=1 Tax=Acrobeloides nanus TaxID=290746 RepID=A0A914CMD0_9BILA
MLILIAILLIVSCIILLLEEYVEDSEFSTARSLKESLLKKLPFDTKGALDKKANANADTTPPEISSDCSNRDLWVLVSSCLPCTMFEMNAMKSSHCSETGYYDKYNCSIKNEIIYVPCYAKRLPISMRFYYFAFICWTMSAGLTAFIMWRRSILERRAFARLQNIVG